MTARFLAAIPKLASLDIARSVAFYVERLGFRVGMQQADYAILVRDGIEIHLWPCDDPSIPKVTGCRINVTGIDALYAEYASQNVIHPKDPLADKPWGLREFSVLDVDRNLITFGQLLP